MTPNLGGGSKSRNGHGDTIGLWAGACLTLPPVPARTSPKSIANWLRLRWRIEGVGALVVPKFAGKGRAEGLWRTTCFEAFLKPEGGIG